MILASILITNDGYLPSPLPRVVRENIESFRQNHEGIEHVLFDNAAIRDFLSVNFDRGVLAAYDDLIPNSFRADLARYCIIYKLGGVYSDLSYFITASIAPVAGRLSVFRDPGTVSPWAVYNGLFSAPAGHPALARAIDMVCDNVRRGYHGVTALAPTGPTLFGKAIAMTCEPEDLIVGEVFRPHGSLSSACLIDMRTDTLVAVSRKKVAGSIEALGVLSGNNYNELWNARTIYRSHASHTKSWNAGWLFSMRFTGGTPVGDVLLIEGTGAGVLTWGPYIALEPGSYEASVVGSGLDGNGDFTVDVATSLGQEVVAEAHVRLPSPAQESFAFTLPFTLMAPTSQMEFRLHARGPHRIFVKEVRLTKVGDWWPSTPIAAE